jgi:hypothetical protein
VGRPARLGVAWTARFAQLFEPSGIMGFTGFRPYGPMGHTVMTPGG